MPIATKFLREFDAVTRAGGTEDFERGFSSLELLAPQAAQFRVSSAATVLEWSEPQKLGARCDCVAFQKYPELCHHVWTAVLAFDQSSQSEIVEVRTEREVKPLAIQRLSVERAMAALQDAVDVKTSATWPFAKIGPQGRLDFSHVDGKYRLDSIGFDYGGFSTPLSSPRREFLDKTHQRRIKRNLSSEKEWLKEFKGEFAPKKIEGRLFSSTEFKTFVSEHPSWTAHINGQRLVILEVTDARIEEHEGFYDFSVKFSAGDQSFSLADLTQDEAGHGGLLKLRDGLTALIPDEWSKRLELLSHGSVASKNGALRFSRTSLPLFKPVFAEIAQLTLSEDVRQIFESLSSLERTGQAQAPTALKASLRSYQLEGLFWLQKMLTAGFGGILADDMGLGKTVQIISYLLGRRMHFRAHPEEQKPCLVVVPKSLVSNWKNEVEKFGPTLRVLDFAGANRVIFRPQHFDIVLTTYHVLKNEIDRLKLVDFDTIILDEAQAIKNPTSQVAKAVFQLKAQQRFALSGTPIENSLRDLFSLLHFTNPGLIPPALNRIYGERKSLSLPKGVSERIAASVRPFILRRTKKQVLKELPDKSEQVLFCEMDGPQKSLYDKTRRHFRVKLKESASESPSGPQQTRVFEALLRLRQISCHPSLVGESMESTKVEMLLEHLADIRAAGNKALVFSQFTSFLDLLKPELEKAEIPFEHLDGQTRNRGAVVDRFNSNPDTTVFLISLKAGGTGLNLTTASYVFLMDPWWNPAIESQAIDRAYRMGQKQKVMAYRLIAKGTIEEKILKLQDQKRNLAQSLISNDATGPSLSLEDLEYLLGE